MRRIKLATLVVLSCVLSGCSEQWPDDHKIIDASGKTVIELGSDSALRGNHIGSHFVDGIMKRGSENHWRYMRTDGSYLPGEFYKAGIFSDGMAAVEPHFVINKEGFQVRKVGFIDAHGQLVIAPQFAEVTEFRDGLCPVRAYGQEQWGIIDKTGRWVVKPIFQGAQVYSEGLLPVGKNGLWGYIDKAGTFVISPKFKYANGFHEGLAQVTLPGGEGSFVCINPKGEIVFDSLNEGAFTKEQMDSMAVSELIHEHENIQYKCGVFEGKLRFSRNNKYGFCDTTGKVVIAPVFDYADNFSEGLVAVVRIGKPRSKVMYVDGTGKIAIDGNFQKGRPFHDGLAAVQKENGDWIFIDKTGKQAFDAKFSSARSFYDGRAVVNYLLSAPCL